MTVAIHFAGHVGQTWAQVAPEVHKYVPGPVTPSFQVLTGAVLGVIPFIIGSYEFGKRLVSPHFFEELRCFALCAFMLRNAS
jgi:hypothetical protein